MADLTNFLRKLGRISIKRWFTTLAVVIGFSVSGVAGLTVLSPTVAGASGIAHVHEGQDGNNLVCGGVPTKALLMKYANGGTDPCGHRDISAIWAAMGITPQIARTMVSQTVCTSEGFISSGRQASPEKSENVWHHLKYAYGTTTYRTSPLLAFGPGCYLAWVGHTEDGRTVAILKGCGNAEATKLPPAHPVKVPPVPTPAQKCVANGGKWDSSANACTTTTVTTAGNCNITTIVYGSGNTVTNTISNSCNTTTTQTPPPTSTPAAQVSCSLALSNTSGNTVSATVYITASNETATAASITWTSGVTSSVSVNGSTASGSYTFSTYGTYTVSATVQATGSTGTASSQCSQTVVIPAPPVKPQISCSLVLSNPSGNTVNATVYIVSNETSNTASITWAPNVTTSAGISGTTASGGYTFPASGTYTVSATVQATGSTGTTSSQCSSTVTIPPPPVVTLQAPIVNDVTSPEMVYVGTDYPMICADITAPSGDSLTVTFSAQIGNFPSASFTVDSLGTNQVCTTYYAPTNTADIGTDTITVTAYDSTTHLSGVSSSESFPVEDSPSNP